jgi:hypothetical protein
MGDSHRDLNAWVGRMFVTFRDFERRQHIAGTAATFRTAQ